MSPSDIKFPASCATCLVGGRRGHAGGGARHTCRLKGVIRDQTGIPPVGLSGWTGDDVATASPDELRTQLVDAVRELFTAGVMSHSGHANVSARADGDTMVISNTGRVRQLRPDQFAVVRLDGEVVEGDITPENREIVSMHTRVYQTRGDIGVIIHTHSPATPSAPVSSGPSDPPGTRPGTRYRRDRI